RERKKRLEIEICKLKRNLEMMTLKYKHLKVLHEEMKIRIEFETEQERQIRKLEKEKLELAREITTKIDSEKHKDDLLKIKQKELQNVESTKKDVFHLLEKSKNDYSLLKGENENLRKSVQTLQEKLNIIENNSIESQQKIDLNEHKILMLEKEKETLESKNKFYVEQHNSVNTVYLQSQKEYNNFKSEKLGEIQNLKHEISVLSERIELFEKQKLKTWIFRY
ncbi:unnamed protein product, partial [marine sediment metagenome]